MLDTYVIENIENINVFVEFLKTNGFDEEKMPVVYQIVNLLRELPNLSSSDCSIELSNLSSSGFSQETNPKLNAAKSAVAKRAEYGPEIVMKKWEMLFDELLKIPGQK